MLSCAQKDYRILSLVRRIANSLGYSCSKITLHSSCECYYFNLIGTSRLQLFLDLEKSISKYGELAGLWEKHENLLGLAQKNLFSSGIYWSRGISIKVILALEKRDLEFREIRMLFPSSPRKTVHGTLMRLMQKGYLQRINRGRYSISERGKQIIQILRGLKICEDRWKICLAC